MVGRGRGRKGEEVVDVIFGGWLGLVLVSWGGGFDGLGGLMVVMSGGVVEEWRVAVVGG